MRPSLASQIREWKDADEAVIIVRLLKTEGSTPRGTDAVMAVTRNGSIGTIGGGQLEFLAIDHARKIIAGQPKETRLDMPLGPEIGQCCGGRVAIGFSVASDADITVFERQEMQESKEDPAVLVFGAGHTGLALASMLALVPVKSMLIDSRPEAIAKASDKIEARLVAMPESMVREAPAGSAFAVMTHEHSLDFLIAAEALGRGDAAYCGMIGSATKRAVFVSWLADNGYARSLADHLTCPIGGTKVRDKRPEIIAAMTLSEILTALIGEAEDSQTKSKVRIK